MFRESLKLPLLLAAFMPLAAGQTQPDLAKILDRLNRVEEENRKLQEEIRSLHTELATLTAAAASQSDVANRVEVQESRTAELAQSKVETSQRMPVSLTGMLLFNAFHNGRQSGTAEYPVVAGNATGPSATGATLRQTTLGLAFNGPELPGGGKASGTVFMDFYPGGIVPGGNTMRLRLATLDLKWGNTTFTIGQDKPIIAPREPVSLAQVGVSPLTGAGNLWDWQPQARIQQRVAFNKSAGMLVQAGVYQTSENDIATPASLPRNLERARPGYEGRIEFFAGSESRRVEIAPGFHFSTTHFNGVSVPSRTASLDWLIKPSRLYGFDGAAFTGENLANLGTLREGLTVLPSGAIIPVHTNGAWGQFSLLPTSRLSFHLFTGAEGDRARDLNSGGIFRNLFFGGNLMYRLAPNMIAALEASHTITSYVNQGTRTNNHYDLAIAYQF